MKEKTMKKSAMVMCEDFHDFMETVSGEGLIDRRYAKESHLVTIFYEYKTITGKVRSYCHTKVVQDDTPYQQLIDEAPNYAENIRVSFWDDLDDLRAFADRQNAPNEGRLLLLDPATCCVIGSLRKEKLFEALSTREYAVVSVHHDKIHLF